MILRKKHAASIVLSICLSCSTASIYAGWLDPDRLNYVCRKIVDKICDQYLGLPGCEFAAKKVCGFKWGGNPKPQGCEDDSCHA